MKSLLSDIKTKSYPNHPAHFSSGTTAPVIKMTGSLFRKTLPNIFDIKKEIPPTFTDFIQRKIWFFTIS